MSAPHLDVLHRLLHSHGYAFAEDALVEACAHHPEHVCALLSAVGTITVTRAQILALTDAASLLCDVHADGGTDSVLSLRERLDRVADALTAALAQRDAATAALRHACQALHRTDIPLLTVRADSSANNGASGPTP
ncbi:hypothetical protein [Micromonospora sp. CPCC 205556]|uniref:hypothetical protein n=1 Tax=Micromonospora sp. CPCC 205556 TaxID=3122398 RepID=UPI002FF005A6